MDNEIYESEKRKRRSEDKKDKQSHQDEPQQSALEEEH